MSSGATEFPQILGILNVTPDSFSDGGKFMSLEKAVEHAEQMLAAGADLIDIGGESTRPGAEPVDLSAEIDRVVPVVAAVSKLCPVSVDTQKPEVAREAVAAGAQIINDVSASLSLIAAELEVGWIAMHKQGSPGTMQASPSYRDVVAEVRAYLVAKASLAVEQGVKKVWIDPGFGFGKSLKHNLALLANVDRLVATDFPVVVGVSRKSMLGQMLAFSDGSDDPVAERDRLDGSLWAAAFSMLKGASVIRVHDVEETCHVRSVLASG